MPKEYGEVFFPFSFTRRKFHTNRERMIPEDNISFPRNKKVSVTNRERMIPEDNISFSTNKKKHSAQMHQKEYINAIKPSIPDKTAG